MMSAFLQYAPNVRAWQFYHPPLTGRYSRTIVRPSWSHWWFVVSKAVRGKGVYISHRSLLNRGARRRRVRLQGVRLQNPAA